MTITCTKNHPRVKESKGNSTRRIPLMNAYPSTVPSLQDPFDWRFGPVPIEDEIRYDVRKKVTSLKIWNS